MQELLEDRTKQFYRNRKVLVTGGTGFIGTHLAAWLIRCEAQVTVVEHLRRPVLAQDVVKTVRADLCLRGECEAALTGYDFVFHAAGDVAGVGATPLDAMASIATNLTLTSNVLYAAWKNGVERILVFSSSTGYPVSQQPLTEDEMWSGPVFPGYFGYGWMRRYIERQAEYVALKSATKVAIVRPTAVYGRFDRFDPVSGHVIPSLICRALEGEDPFVVWGTGDEERDFLHIDDFARGCLLTLERHAKADPVNIGYGHTTTIADLVRCVLHEAGRSDVRVVFDATKPTSIPVRTVSTEKAARLLGFVPSVSIEEGIRDTIKWYREEAATRTRLVQPQGLEYTETGMRHPPVSRKRTSRVILPG